MFLLEAQSDEGSAGEERRTFCRPFGSENPRQEEVRLLAIAPGEGGLPACKFPDTFDLRPPMGHGHAVAVPEQDRVLSWSLREQPREVSAKGKGVGFEGETGRVAGGKGPLPRPGECTRRARS